MPSLCHVLVSFNSLRANRSSHGECRCEPRTCPQWPRESCGHQPAHSRRHIGVDLVSGVSALLAWFPASWASKIAPCFIGEKVAPYNSRKKLPLSVPIESSKDCRGMRLTKCYRQSSSPTRMSWIELGAG